MKEHKHTPGPWMVGRRPVGIGLWGTRIIGRGVIIGDTYTQHYGPGQDESEANARLFARAPEILEENDALKAEVARLTEQKRQNDLTAAGWHTRVEKAEAELGRRKQ